jgi:glycosyltransferase involved in cell wall biosynthesis
MKIAIVVGRGFEGAGIQKYILELSAFLKLKDIEHNVFLLDDKKWGRGNMQDKPIHSLITKDNISTIHDELNKFDYVFLNSVSSKKHSEWAQEGFLQMVKDITTKKIIFQNDHKPASIHRNANFFELCELVDGIVSHSITSPFYKKLIELYGAEIRDKFIQLHVGFNFDQLEKYKKEDHIKKITYLGRFATFKAPELLYGLLPYAEKSNLLLEMKGVERSLGALPIFYDDIGKRIPNSKMVECNPKAIEKGLVIDNDKRDLSKVYIFGPYDYVDGMETLSSSLVGADFYHLAEDAYGDNFEYAQCEIVGVGTIPMFSYHWAKNCWVYDKNGNKTGQKFSDLEHYGLFLDAEKIRGEGWDIRNAKEIVEKINDIYSNKALKKKYLECSYEITKDHCDSEWIFQKLIDDVKGLNKAKHIKPKSLF